MNYKGTEIYAEGNTWKSSGQMYCYRTAYMLTIKTVLDTFWYNNILYFKCLTASHSNADIDIKTLYGPQFDTFKGSFITGKGRADNYQVT